MRPGRVALLPVVLGSASAARVALALVAIAAPALARPGGGDLFDGGELPSGGGGGGGDVDIGFVIELVILCFRYPLLGAAVVAGVGVYYVARRLRGSALPDWSVRVPPAQVPVSHAGSVARSTLDRVRGWDPAFSGVLLEDFLYAFYAELQYGRARGGLARLAPFLAPGVAETLEDPGLDAVSGVIIGALRFTELRMHADRIELGAVFEANLGEVRAGSQQRSYVVDRLVFARALTARSRPPARVRKLDCPNCGGPLEGMRGNTCGYCKQDVGGGRLDWVLASIQRLRTAERAQLFAKNVIERGNELPTRVATGAHARLEELRARDPGFALESLERRVRLVFNELSVGWSTRDLARVRGYVSDNLFAYFGYFIDLYLRERAQNVHEHAHIARFELANVLSDSHFDAVTLRLFASGLDYTLGDDGRLLSGSRERTRAYTEYWTLIRGRSVTGRPRSEPVCPNCGAPLKIGMAGNCEYCQARVVTGEFDWVLSRIEQDEAYSG